MTQPTYSDANGYIGETFFTILLDADLDADHPPALNAIEVQVNGTDVTVTGITVNSTARTVVVAINATLLPGDIIDFVYTDPTVSNDLNALQGLDGTDAASFSHSAIVAITRPGPSAPPTPTLDTASDSGTLGDFVTNDNTPTINGTAEANATVKLYDTDGSTLLGTTKADGAGKWTMTSSQLGDGSHTLKVTQTDGSANTSPLSNGLALSIDTVADAPTGMAVSAGSDSGTLGDGISNSAAPVITGKAESGSKVSLYDTDGTTVLGTTTADGNGKWSITSSNLVEGSHTLTTKQTDVAGNVSKASSDFTYIMDTVGPTKFALGSNSVQQTKATNGATITSLNSTDLTSVTYGFAVGNGVIDADNGKFTVSGSNLVAAQNLSSGTYHIYMSATDAAGNGAYQIFTVSVVSGPSVSSIVRVGGAATPASTTSVDYTVTFSESVTGVDASDFTLTPSGSASGKISNITGSGSTYTVTVDTLAGDGTLRLDLNSSGTGIKNGTNDGILSGYTSGETYSLDHTAPDAPSTPAMTAGTDTGASSSDAITKTTTPVFTGTSEANATVNLYDTDGTTLLGTTTADGSGKWSITSSKLSDGDHTVTVKATDAAGNVSKASSSLAAKIDTTAPSAPASPTLSPGSDSGTAGDFLTNVSTPVITGTSEANAIVKLYDTDGSTLLGTTTADGSGKWSITSSTLTDGSHSLTVKQTDQAGNVSTASSSLTLDIDTSVPTSPSAPSMTAGTDTGASSKDSITSNTTPTFTGTGTKGDTVTLYDTDGTTVLGTATVDGSGNWSITASKLGEGVHTLTTKTTNVAGTASAASKSLSATIDTTAPTTTASTVTFSNDTGSSTTDFITKTASQTVSGKLSANLASDETVKVSMDNGTTWLDATATVGQDTYSLTGLTLVGANTLKIAVVDTAGNQSKLTSQAYALDTSGPTTATLTLSKFHFNSGSSGTLTVSFSEKVTGVDVGDFKVGNGTLDTLTTADDGLTWTGKYTPNTPINAVANVISIDLAGVADAAGNAGSGTASSTSFSIDTFPASTPPSVVDGVPVDTKSSTNTDGSTTTTVTITPVSGGRQDTDPTSAQADIPLARTETGEALVSVGLPEGVGVTSTATSGTNLSLEQRLVNASQPRVELPADFAQILTQGIQAYVPTVGDESQVTVRTLTLTTGSSGGTGSTAPAQPIVISGATGTGEADAAHPQRQEALVIDARTLPAGTVLDLRNVEFAIVIGPSRLVGGSGANVVVGDGSQQFIVLGPEDDVLRGGAGDDTVGSKGGNDKLYGDEGNDWVVGGAGNDQLEGGSGNDILQGGQSDAGTWTFTLNNEGTLVSQFLAKDGNLAESWSLLHTGSWAGADGSRTSDDRLAFSYESNQTLKTIASLYNTMKGHLPTVDELNQWSSAGAGTVKALAAALYSDYRAAHSEIASQSLSTQVQSLVAQVWGASNVTQEIINTGVAYITRGGSWEDGLVWLAQQSQATARYTDASGNLALAQSLVVNESGWSSDTGADTLSGGEGNDLLVGGRGNDWLDGGAGLDMAVYSGRITDYSFHQQMVAGVLQTIVTNRYTGEVDTLIGIEYGQVGSKYYGLGMNANGLPPLGQEVAMADYVMEFSRADIALMGIPGV